MNTLAYKGWVTVCDVLDAGACIDGVKEWVERAKVIAGNAIDYLQTAWVQKAAFGYGYGDGYGDGYGYGYGDGDGYGDGYGYGDGDGDGYGYGDGYGDGDGDGYGYGDGEDE